MNQNIGWDAHLERCWNEHTDAQDAYERELDIEDKRKELNELEDKLLTAEAEGWIVEAKALQAQYDALAGELDALECEPEEPDYYDYNTND